MVEVYCGTQDCLYNRVDSDQSVLCDDWEQRVCMYEKPLRLVDGKCDVYAKSMALRERFHQKIEQGLIPGISKQLILPGVEIEQKRAKVRPSRLEMSCE